MPSGACRSDKVASAATSLADLKTLLETKLAEAQEEYFALSTYIESIDDPFIRMIVQDRYINALPWEQIAANIGGGNTANSVRNVHWRYFKRIKS
ncbi:hypothetical protein SDC9_115582 [bioreactor metagenome]|uniref:Uncharacterized protein n=1 Tax=bioreactor metagenome TaxID=1076179 RepID=A0A645BU93_9ZZZZ